MANGTDTTDEEQGQDFRDPNAPAPVVAPAAMPQPRPMVAPGPLARPAINPQWSGAQALERAQMLAGVPLAQAERAVKAAQLFQAQRGYQRDVAGGARPSRACPVRRRLQRFGAG